MQPISRRNWMKQGAAATALFTLPGSGRADTTTWLGGSKAMVPCRAITRGPKPHWFGYYDKLQFDPSNRFVLSGELSFEHRTPTAEDVIGVGMVDLEDGDRWIPLGASRSWGWQQGCMLQWIPGTDSEVIWNDRKDGQFIARVKNVQTGQERILPRPVYALSPDGAWAITADFARIQDMRPGYGYQGLKDADASERSPAESGIWKMDLKTGESTLIVSLEQLAAIPHLGKDVGSMWHYVNHLLVNTDGSRFTFLHRWRAARLDDDTTKVNRGFVTRMFTARADGSDLFLLDPSGYTSHFIWRDPAAICAWTRPVGRKNGFYLLHDKTDRIEPVGEGVMTMNGHNTYLPGTDSAWILNDTYPQGKQRHQQPYLFHVPTGKKVPLGAFHLPSKYTGEWRCDTHPRSSNDGRYVTIDSPHGGNGRQVWLLDVAEAVS